MNRGRGHYRGRGARPSRGQGFKNVSLRVAVDARDKLIDSRRTVDDARTVIRQNVVAKVGDLRTVLNPKRGVAVRGRGRGRGGRFGDLRAGLKRNFGAKANGAVSKPQLVYRNEVPVRNGKAQKFNSKDANVTVSRGGRLTVSRQRGRSIDRDRDLEPVQPTGIPAHMRRQPSPPPPRSYSRSLSPPPPVYRPEQRHDPHVYNNRPRSYTPSPPPPVNRPQSYITSPKRSHPPHHHPADSFTSRDWESRGRLRSDFRSRSPIGRMRGHSPLSPMRRPLSPMRRQLSPMRRQLTPERYYDRRSLSPLRRASPPPRHLSPPRGRGVYERSRSPPRWEERRRSLTPPPPHRPYHRTPSPKQERMMRSYSRSPSPRFQRAAVSSHESRRNRHAYGENVGSAAGLRMDRVSSKTPMFQEKPSVAAGTGSDRRKAPPPSNSEQVYYTIKVTNLSPEVSQSDVTELFGDIGDIVDAKLISQGHAEVIFIQKKDAITAIEKYDRRELDGIPMSLKLVEKSANNRIGEAGRRSSRSTSPQEMLFKVQM